MKGAMTRMRGKRGRGEGDEAEEPKGRRPRGPQRDNKGREGMITTAAAILFARGENDEVEIVWERFGLSHTPAREMTHQAGVRFKGCFWHSC